MYVCAGNICKLTCIRIQKVISKCPAFPTAASETGERLTIYAISGRVDGARCDLITNSWFQASLHTSACSGLQRGRVTRARVASAAPARTHSPNDKFPRSLSRAAGRGNKLHVRGMQHVRILNFRHFILCLRKFTSKNSKTCKIHKKIFSHCNIKTILAI